MVLLKLENCFAGFPVILTQAGIKVTTFDKVVGLSFPGDSSWPPGWPDGRGEAPFRALPAGAELFAELPTEWGVGTAKARGLFCFQKQETYCDFSSNSKIAIKLSQ